MECRLCCAAGAGRAVGGEQSPARAAGCPPAAQPNPQQKAVFEGWCRASLHVQPFPGPRLGVLSCGARYKHSVTCARLWLACSVQTAKLASFPRFVSSPVVIRSHVSSAWAFVYTFRHIFCCWFCICTNKLKVMVIFFIPPPVQLIHSGTCNYGHWCKS